MGEPKNKQPYGIHFFGIDNPAEFKQMIRNNISNGTFKTLYSECDTYVLQKT